MTEQEIELARLSSGPIERARTGLDAAAVEAYAADVDALEPVTVFDTGDELLLADGYHRVEAARRSGRTTIRADVRPGTRNDALRFAVENAKQQRGLTESEILAAIKRRSGL